MCPNRDLRIYFMLSRTPRGAKDGRLDIVTTSGDRDG